MAKGGGGSGGGGSGGTGGGIIGDLDEDVEYDEDGNPIVDGEEGEEEAEMTPSSDVLKEFTMILIIICTVVCMILFAIDYYKREFREKKDLVSVLGLCLAQISNEEERNPNNIIQNGVGTDEKNIEQWVNDIWETYDFNDDGNIDKREIKKFVD